MATQGIGVLAGFIQRDLGLSNAAIGSLAGVLNVAPILGLLFVGELLDRIGERAIIVVGAAIIAAAMASSFFVSSLAGLLACLFFVGAGYSTAQPGGSKAVFVWFSGSGRGLAMGIRQAGLPLGGVVAAAVFPYLAKHFGWHSALLAGAVIVAIGGLIFLAFYRPPPAHGEDAARQAGRQNLFRYMGSVMAHAELRQALCAGVVLITFQIVALMFLMLYFRDRFAVPLTVGALHLLVMQLSGAAGRIVLAACSDRLQRNRALIVLGAALAVVIGLAGLILFPSAADPRYLFALSAWLGFFGFGWYGPWVAWISERSPRENLGATLGIAMAANQVAIVAMPILFGLLVDISHRYVIAWATLAAATLLYTLYAGFHLLKGRH